MKVKESNNVRLYLSDRIVIPVPSDIECPSCKGNATIYCSDYAIPAIYCKNCGLKSLAELFEPLEPLFPKIHEIYNEKPITDEVIPKFTLWLKRYFDPLISTADPSYLLKDLFYVIESPPKCQTIACRTYICEGLFNGYMAIKNYRLTYVSRTHRFKRTGGIIPRDSVFKSDLAIFLSPMDAIRCYAISARLKNTIDIPIYAFVGWHLRRMRRNDSLELKNDLFPAAFLNINRRARTIFAIPKRCAQTEINKVLYIAEAIDAYISVYDPTEIDDVDTLISTIARRAKKWYKLSFIAGSKPFRLQKDKLIIDRINEYDGVVLLGSGYYVIMKENCWIDALSMTPMTNFAAKIVDIRSGNLVVEITYISGEKVVTEIPVARVSGSRLSSVISPLIVKAIKNAGLIPILSCPSQLITQLTILASDKNKILEKFCQIFLR